MELWRKALIETAMAYWNRGVYAQYDSEPMTYQERTKTGPSRLCSGAAPEMASGDWTLYTVCSDFCYNVYKNCFDYELMGSPRNCLTFNMTTLPADHPAVVVKGGREDGIQDKEAALRRMRENLQVGDIIVEYARALNGGPKGGHAMLYLGDFRGDGTEYIIHSGGSKISMETGIDQTEPNGTIRLDDVDEHCFTRESDSKHNCYLAWFDEFVLLRPFADPAFPATLTQTAKARLQYPGICIDRYFDRHRYLGAQPGETVTVSVSVKNTSGEDYCGVRVEETLPQGEVPCWTVDVPAGSTVVLTHPVKVGEDGELRLPAGRVGGIPTRPMSLQIRANNKKSRTATQFANGFCRAAYGTDPGLPENPVEMITGLFDVVDVPDVKKTDGKLLAPKPYEALTPQFRAIRDKLLPEHLSGRAVYLGHDPFTMACFNRVKVLDEGAYLPGDVFFCLESPSILKLGKPKRAVVYIYLGEGQVMTWDVEKGPVVKSFAETVSKALRMNVLLALRP